MPSSLFSLATLALVATPAVATSYSLVHNFDESNFFQNFSFYSGVDPTDGFVQYLDYESAYDAGLASVDSGNVYLGADFTNTYTTGGRPSTRVESNFEFTQGLLVADLAHMPGNACGVWPAFWTMGPNWPDNGEIDIIEGVSNQSVNSMTLHTENQCSISTTTETGTLYTSECSETDSSGGCSIEGTQGSYGDSFNDLGGGVYAVEWTSDFIKIWFFSRANIPDCITSGSPDPSEFGTPMAYFQGSCDFESDFQSHSIIFNTDFCGSWAGSDFASSGCPMSNPDDATASCEAYVGNNPSAFTEAYWEIASVKIYQESSGTTSPSSSVSSASLTSSTSSTSLTSLASSTSSASSTSATSTSVYSYTIPASRIVPTSQSAVKSHSSSSPAHSSSAAVAGAAGVFVQTTSSCSSKSTVTVTSVVTPSSSAIASKSVALVTSAPARPSVNAVSVSSSKLTTTTVVITSYVDVCPSGYTTKTITETVTYCPADASTSSIGPVFTTTSKFCATGCGPSPTTVIVVIPIESATAATTPGSGAETSPAVAVVSTAVTVPTATPGSGSIGGSAPARASSSIRVPAAASSSAVAKASGPSGSSPESGSVTSTAVSPAFTGAATKTSSSFLCLAVVVAASVVLFI